MLRPMMAGPYDPIEDIEQRVREGLVPPEEVESARSYWQEHLSEGLRLPNGQRLVVTYRDMHHLMLDGRIRRKPERMMRIVAGIFEIQTADAGRRIAFSSWNESGQEMVGYLVIDGDDTTRTAHLTDARKLQKLRRKGTILWTSSRRPSPGQGQSTIN